MILLCTIIDLVHHDIMVYDNRFGSALCTIIDLVVHHDIIVYDNRSGSAS